MKVFLYKHSQALFYVTSFFGKYLHLYSYILICFALNNVEINNSENVNLYLQSALTCKTPLYSKVSHKKIQTEPFVTSPCIVNQSTIRLSLFVELLHLCLFNDIVSKKYNIIIMRCYIELVRSRNWYLYLQGTDFHFVMMYIFRPEMSVSSNTCIPTWFRLLMYCIFAHTVHVTLQIYTRVSI